ncbi:hypothetical protein L1887_16492 [Cichorium endivia]|nr:hypothetical protein L1887_16492 [Cichorium endivia]
MKEHEDDVLPTVKESTTTVDSTTADETVTARGKIEGLFGERDDGEDMVVDVVGADVVVDDRGGTRVDLDVKSGVNGLVEEGSKREIESDDKDVDEVGVVEEVKVVTSEKVEVVVSDEGVKTSVEVSKEVIQVNEVTERDSTKEIVEQSTDSVQEVADGDNVMDETTGKESDVSNSLKFSESRDAHVAAVQEGLFGKDEAEDVVNAGTGEDNVHVSPKNLDPKPVVDQTEENLQPTVEVATSDVQDSGNLEQAMESVQEVADEVQDSKKIPDSEAKVDGVVVEEGKTGKDETQDGVSKDPSLESTDVDEGLTEKTVKQATESVQEVADVDNENSGKDEVLDSTKIPSLLNDAVNDGTGEGTVDENFDQKAEIQMEKEDTSHSTIEVTIDNTQKSGSIEGEIVEQSVGPVQEAVDKDHVMDEKTEKEVEVLDSSKIPESSSIMANLGSEEVDQKAGVDHNEVAFTEANQVTTDEKLPNPIGISVENQMLNVDVEMKVENFDEVNNSTSHADYGDDAGMDIDEVLGWKDEIPGIDPLTSQEKDQDFKINTNPEPNLEHGLSKVYERRVHINDDVEEHTDFCRQQESESVDQSTLSDFVTENEASVSLQQFCYFHPPEKEGEFSASDLVWGKVRSHPWWPGQIFDQSDASDKAMKYYKKDRFLVGYFGDRTFAWNDATVLKPFRAKFSQIEKHTKNSDAFNNALSCALEEVSRRVELGLACSCTPRDIYKKIECQIVENAGIKKDSSRRHGMDKTALVTSFEPDKLVDYVRLLAKSPYGENDKMDLVMAKAQLLSCARYKGYRQLSEYQFCGNLLEDSSEASQGVDLDLDLDQDQNQVIKKERNFQELKVDPIYYSGDSEEGSRKRKASDSNSNSDVPEKRQTLESVTPSPKPSFKVGEVIQRFATQLSDKNVEPPVDQIGLSGSGQTPVNPQVNLPEMLSQLQLTAQDPMKGYSFLNTIIPFFYSHRSAVFTKSLKQNSSTGRVNESRKRKPNENDPEDFEFDDVNDSYWTDRIIQNHPEELQQQQQQQQQQVQVHDNQNGGVEHQIVAYEEKEKPVMKQSRRSNKKRFFSSNHEIEAKEQSELIERRRLNLATEVLMKFTEGIYFPSEIHLNKMFRRFGPLMESETE